MFSIHNDEIHCCVIIRQLDSIIYVNSVIYLHFDFLQDGSHYNIQGFACSLQNSSHSTKEKSPELWLKTLLK